MLMSMSFPLEQINGDRGMPSVLITVTAGPRPGQRPSARWPGGPEPRRDTPRADRRASLNAAGATGTRRSPSLSRPRLWLQGCARWQPAGHRLRSVSGRQEGRTATPHRRSARRPGYQRSSLVITPEPAAAELACDEAWLSLAGSQSPVMEERRVLRHHESTPARWPGGKRRASGTVRQRACDQHATAVRAPATRLGKCFAVVRMPRRWARMHFISPHEAQVAAEAPATLHRPDLGAGEVRHRPAVETKPMARPSAGVAAASYMAAPSRPPRSHLRAAPSRPAPLALRSPGLRR